MQEQITKEMTIEDIFRKFPSKSQKLAQEMTNMGLNCVGCCASTWETLEAGMYSHGMDESQIQSLVGKLNRILAEKEDPTTITLTEKAAKKIQAILIEEGKTGWGLRFGEKAAGCSGFEYFLDYSEKAKPEDQVFKSSGVEIHVNAKSVGKLLGSVIDFVDGLNGAGFKITNPNVKASCGCGNSHGY
jgi:iron-sulfur cluster assembly accessory protein